MTATTPWVYFSIVVVHSRIALLLTVNSVLHSRIISVRHSWAAFCSCSSRWSGMPWVFRLLLGLDDDPLRDAQSWNKDGAKHTAKLLAVIWQDKIRTRGSASLMLCLGILQKEIKLGKRYSPDGNVAKMNNTNFAICRSKRPLLNKKSTVHVLYILVLYY